MVANANPKAVPGGPQSESRFGRLGLLAEGLCLEAAEQITVGATTAVQGFVAAMFQHRGVDACDIFAPAAALEGTRRQVARLSVGLSGAAGQVWPLEGIADKLAAAPPVALHDPSGDLFHLHYLRSRVAPGPYPITVAHHTVSFAFWRYQMLLPLLMAGYRPCDAIVCSSSAGRKAIAVLLAQMQEALNAEYDMKLGFPGRLEIIPLGVDVRTFRPRDRDEARAQLGLPAQKLILLALGRFSDSNKMDLDPLLAVFRQLRRASRRELLLVLAGSDPHGYAERVRALVAEYGLHADVQILVNLPSFFPPLLYAAADLFVSVADNVQEMFGQTPVEAMAAGLPVVVADWDGYRDTVIHGETGFRVPTLWGCCDADLCALAPLTPPMQDHGLLAQSVAVDCRRLFEALTMLTQNDALRQRMGAAARRRAVLEYSWAAVLGRYNTLWEELSGQARATPADPGRHLGFLCPDYTGAFGHFATSLLSTKMRLRPTKLGERAVRDRAALRVSPAIAPYLNAGLLRQILALLLVPARLRRPLCLATVLEALRTRCSSTEPAGRRHIMFLIKHGLIEVVEE